MEHEPHAARPAATPDYSSLLSTLEYVNCDLCGRDSADLLSQVKGKVTGYLFNIMRCRDCGLVYVNPRISREGSNLLYDRFYFEGKHADHSIDYVADLVTPDSHESRLKRGISRRILEIMRGFGSPGGRFLDLGCGNGQLLGMMSRAGFSVCGVDISPASCAIARGQGFEVYCGDITDNILPHAPGSFDVIAAIEVLEHLHSPGKCLQRVAQLLRPGGLFYYTTGNADRMKVMGKDWSYIIPESHIYYFSPRTISLYFGKVSLQVLSPVDYPGIITMDAVTTADGMRNLMRMILLHSRFLRRAVLNPFLELTHNQYMPLARKLV